MQWKRTILGLSLAFGLALAPSPAKACDDGGCGDDWSGGFYATGGYNLLDFGADLYNISSYGDDSWGGSCGSLMGSCGGGYSSAGLYGSDWGMGSLGYDTSYTTDIDISLLGMGSYGGSSGGCDVGCSVGYCGGGGYMPFMGGGMGSFPMGGFPMTMPMMPTASPFIGGLQNFPWSPTGPFMGVPPYNNIPPFTQLPPPAGNFPIGGLIPPTLPPWGGCDGVIVQCPTGPVTPPVYNPMVNYLPNPGNSTYIPRGGPIFTPPTIGIPGLPGGGIDTHNPGGFPITIPGTGVYTPPSTSIPGVGVYTPPSSTIPGLGLSPPGIGSPTVYTGGVTTSPGSPIVYTDPRTGTPSIPNGGGFIIPGSTIPTGGTYTAPSGGPIFNPVNGGIFTAPSGVNINPGSTGAPIVYTGGSNGSPGSPIVYTDPRTGTPTPPTGGGSGTIPIVTIPGGGAPNGGSIPVTNVPGAGGGGTNTAPIYTGGTTASPTAPTTYTVPRSGL